ncbi:glycosyltransferase family 4 protein [Kaistella flava (ex Peng et al. 2021)]|uniref:Glycosyltransferase family 4 protein n=1 Tax=Kaistella flava (ex Peng et al. 2021) TaxID=2038776 RepID=A0A7M2Y8P1_9FLAO|nr:glycosyltransferase family 4 protein [Kaistella flava (ex Peng et al. 2021)]QOW10628.1 glycosyltransferase family 4 protein [Kaistella flava (ex Peng et al. 2021)]
MKILRLTTLLDFGGQEKKYISFTEKPELLQHQYIFAAIGFGGSAEKILRKRNFEVHILNRNFSIRNLSNIFSLYKLIRKIKPDVVHTAAAEANFHGIIAAKLAGVKTIIGEEIGIPNHSSIAQKVFSAVYRLADKVICVSKSVKTHLITIGEITAYKGIVVYNPVSFSTVFNKSSSESFTMVYIGRLEKVKNVQTLLKAFAKLKNTEMKLVVVGDGRERSNLETLAKELKIFNRVAFVGFQEEPAEFLAVADLFVLPSFSEGFGIAAVEAMFQQVPVLCSNVGGIPEFVQNGENGWLFNPNDIDELHSKLEMIISKSEQERKLIGFQGFNDVKDEFTIEKYIKNLEEIYIKEYA